MIKPILSKKPIKKRKITEGIYLNYGKSGAFKSKVALPPELYGSRGPGKVYLWENNERGKLIGNIVEIRGVDGTTMLTWGKPVRNSVIKITPGVVTTKCATGGGYFDKSRKNGWETGTFYDFEANKKVKLAHVWNIDSKDVIHIWEVKCPGNKTAKCQKELEELLRGTKSDDDSKLKIYYITAPKLKRGVRKV